MPPMPSAAASSVTCTTAHSSGSPALAMNLGIAKATITDLPDPARRALDEAHDDVKQTLSELRTKAVGYLLKDRVADVEEFVDAVRRVADGGTALDPEVVAQLLVRRTGDPLGTLTPRERDVLELMAAGHNNPGIAAVLVISESAVAKHVNAIFAKLDMSDTESPRRRVVAVLQYLSAQRN